MLKAFRPKNNFVRRCLGIVRRKSAAQWKTHHPKPCHFFIFTTFLIDTYLIDLITLHARRHISQPTLSRIFYIIVSQLLTFLGKLWPKSQHLVGKHATPQNCISTLPLSKIPITKIRFSNQLSFLHSNKRISALELRKDLDKHYKRHAFPSHKIIA